MATATQNIRVPVAVRDRVQHKRSREPGSAITSTDVVRQALRAFVDDPREADGVIGYARNTTHGETVQLCYRIDAELWGEAQRRCDDLMSYALSYGVIPSASLVAVRALDRFAGESDDETRERLQSMEG